MTVKERGGDRSLKDICRLLGYTRQAYHKRHRREEREAIKTELIVQEVAKIRVVQKRVGSRKLHHLLTEFRTGHGIKMGRDRLNELLREHSMQIRKRRRRAPRTTFSSPWKRYPNLIRDIEPARADQVWVSDITYVRVGEGFCYLSLITDAYSRKIVGYNLSRDLSASGCVKSLKMALRDNPDREALIHHSDRGLQYYSSRYVKLLGKIRISMTEKSDPLENAIAERVNGILKQELLAKRFENFREARSNIDEAVDIYNNLRPHLSIDMLTPAEAHTRRGTLKRHWKSYFSNRPVAQAAAYAAA
ncbi:MAG: IS3 family transposase [Pyrinomonadaceae bacterium]